MNVHDLDVARAEMQVRWDSMRERRVLSRMLGRYEQRARRRRAATWMAAVAVALLLPSRPPQTRLDDRRLGRFRGCAPRELGDRRQRGDGAKADAFLVQSYRCQRRSHLRSSFRAASQVVGPGGRREFGHP